VSETQRSGPSQVDGVQHVFHPSDFSPASAVAFAHALKIALLRGASLDIMHVASYDNTEWSEVAGVRSMLERWGLLPPQSERSDVAALGIDVKKVSALDSDPVRAVLRYLKSHPTDLIVLATRQQEPGFNWLRDSVARPIAEGAHQMTLYIPQGRPGFVSAEDGSVSLHSVLVPIAAEPPPQPAIDAARWVTEELRLPPGTVTVLYVGQQAECPSVQLPAAGPWRWNRLIRQGDVVDTIVQAAEETQAGLVVMATNGRDGFLDVFRGSHSERVFSRLQCPLLNLPIGSLLG
jgi:nucleotide-binding universal stress UspA family protein